MSRAVAQQGRQIPRESLLKQRANVDKAEPGAPDFVLVASFIEQIPEKVARMVLTRYLPVGMLNTNW
jgi:hypothetical protein